MKSKFVVILPAFLLAAAFLPHFASAADACTAPGYPAECGIGQICGPNSFCIPDTSSGNSVTGAGTSGSGGLNTGKIESLVISIRDFINGYVITLLMAVAFLVFLYGVADAYILHPDDEGKRTAGHKYIMYGIVGFVVIFSIWGLVRIGIDLFNLGGQSVPGYPKV